MSRKHGRAVMPFGKYRGVQVRLIPDAYLSWLSSTAILAQPNFGWLMESVMAELRHRGLKTDEAHMELLEQRKEIVERALGEEIELKRRAPDLPFERKLRRAIRFA